MQHGQGPGAAGMLHAAVVVVDGKSDVADDDSVDDDNDDDDVEVDGQRQRLKILSYAN